MYKFLTFLAVVIAATSALRSQTTCTSHPADPGATLLGSFTCAINLTQAASGPQGELFLSGGPGSCMSQIEVCVWRTSAGKVDYVIDARSIRFSGDCDELVDGTSTTTLFDWFARAAVERGAALGYGPCNPSCTTADTSSVFQVSCVLRSEHGTATTFTPCDATAFCSRSFTICCPNGPNAPVSTLIPGSGMTTCSPTGELLSGCETTCP